MCHISKQIKSAMRIMHIGNIPHVLRYGIVRRDSTNANPDYIPIGDKTLIDSRNEYKIPGTSFILGDFIPFYFGPRSPMLYEIQNGNINVAERKPEDIVYCIILIKDVIDRKLRGFFTDGHAKSAMTSFYPNSRLNDLNQLVSYNDVYERHWGTYYDNTNEKKRRKSAELLLHDDIAPELIKYFVVYNESAKQRLVGYGVSAKIIYIVPDFYF